MINFIHKENLDGAFPNLDNITKCGKDQSEHDTNLEHFLDVVKQKNMTYNNNKSVFSTRCLPILGYIVEEGKICPDPECLRPPPPQ